MQSFYIDFSKIAFLGYVYRFLRFRSLPVHFTVLSQCDFCGITDNKGSQMLKCGIKQNANETYLGSSAAASQWHSK